MISKHSIIIIIGLVFVSGCDTQTPEQKIVEARTLINEHDTDTAEILLKSVIKINSENAEARYLLGKIYLKKHFYDRAEKELSKALELNYNKADVLPLLALAYKRTDAANALLAIDHTLKDLTTDEQVQIGFYKLQSMAALGKFGELRRLIAELTKYESSSVYKALVGVYENIASQDLERALEKVILLRKQAPKNEDVMRVHLRLLLGVGKLEDTKTVLSDIVAIRPDDNQTKILYISTLIRLGDFEIAKPLVDELFQLTDENPLLHQYASLISLNEKKYQEALFAAEKSIRFGLDTIANRATAGYSAYHLGRFSDTVKHFENIVANYGYDLPISRMLALSQLKIGKNEAAMKTLLEVESFEEHDARLQATIGYQLLRDGNINSVKNLFENDLKIDAKADDLLRIGVIKMSLNEKAGLLALKGAVSKSGSSHPSRKVLGKVYLHANQLEEAKKHAEDWKKESSDGFDALLYSAEVAMYSEQFDIAESELSKANNVSPNRPEVSYLNARIELAKGNTSDAISNLKSLMSEHPGFVPSYTLLYQLIKQSTQYEELTSSLLASALQQLSSSPSAELRTLVSKIYFDKENFEDALETFNVVDFKRSTDLNLWRIKGLTLIAAEKYNLAEQHFKAWKNFMPLNHDATIGLIKLLDINKNYEEAAILTEQYLSKRENKQIRILQAHFYSKIGKLESAQNVLSNLSEQEKSLPFVRAIYARLYFKSSNFEMAAVEAKEAYRGSPNFELVALRVASLEQIGRKDEAYTVLENHLKRFKGDIGAILMLAERQVARNVERAVETYSFLNDALPNNAMILNNLAFCLYKVNRLDKALVHAKEAVRISPSSASMVDTLAQIYIADNNFGKAVNLYKTINGSEMSDKIFFNFLQALEQSDNLEVAKRRFFQREWQNEALRAGAIKILKLD